MGKISIKKSELDRIIKEEAMKFKKAITLKSEIEKINAELKKLNENDNISEVTAGEEMNANANGGVHAGQKKPNFSTKNGNPHLKMEEEEEITDVEADVDTDAVENVDSDTVSKSDLLKAINDLKMSLGLHDELATDEPVAGGEEGGVEGAENTDEPAEEDGDEIFEFEEGAPKEEVVAPKQECGAPMEETAPKQMEENLDEPIEGKSVAQAAKEDTVNDNMEKDKHVKAATDLMEAEKKRMAQLAGIMKG